MNWISCWRDDSLLSQCHTNRGLGNEVKRRNKKILLMMMSRILEGRRAVETRKAGGKEDNR